MTHPQSLRWIGVRTSDENSSGLANRGRHDEPRTHTKTQENSSSSRGSMLDVQRGNHHPLDGLHMELHHAIQLEHQERLRTNEKLQTRSNSMKMGSPYEDPMEEEAELEIEELQMSRLSLSMASGFVHAEDPTVLAEGGTSYDEGDGYEDEAFLLYERDDDKDNGDEGGYFVESPEIAAFLGMSIPQQQQGLLPPMAPKAASFSGQYHHNHNQPHRPRQQQQQQRMMPCSPPVPIPTKQWKRRRNSVTGSLLSRSGGGVFMADAEFEAYSKTQCEARLWDEYWNYKLSLESRESFEASNSNSTNQPSHSPAEKGSSSRSPTSAVWKPHSTSSMTSTTDTTRDEESTCFSDCDDNDDAHQVFDMDDL